MSRSAARWIWLALIALQVVWFGALVPLEFLGPAGSVALFAVPLLVPAWWIARRNLRGIVVGGLILMFYFCFAVAEAWAQPASRIPALIQIALITWFYVMLFEIWRRERRKD